MAQDSEGFAYMLVAQFLERVCLKGIEMALTGDD
jgi:hypothetical protein